jgi:hypothetical protein
VTSELKTIRARVQSGAYVRAAVLVQAGASVLRDAVDNAGDNDNITEQARVVRAQLLNLTQTILERSVATSSSVESQARLPPPSAALPTD